MPEVVRGEQWSAVPTGCSGPLSGSKIASGREAVDRAYRAVSCLPHEQKMVIVMHCLEDMSYAEIAKAMRCSVGTVKSRIHAGRLSLKRMLLDESNFDR